MPAIVVEAVGRIDVVAVLGAADADLGIPGQEAIDALGRAPQRRGRAGHACRGYQRWTRAWLRASTVTPRAANAFCNCRITASSAAHEVSGSRIEHIVIVDAVVGRAMCQPVPHGLHQASRDEPRIRQSEAEQFTRYRRVDGLRSAAVRNSVWFMSVRSLNVIARSTCDEAILLSFAGRDGLLRFARNDGKTTTRLI